MLSGLLPACFTYFTCSTMLLMYCWQWSCCGFIAAAALLCCNAASSALPPLYVSCSSGKAVKVYAASKAEAMSAAAALLRSCHAAAAFTTALRTALLSKPFELLTKPLSYQCFLPLLYVLFTTSMYCFTDATRLGLTEIVSIRPHTSAYFTDAPRLG